MPPATSVKPFPGNKGFTPRSDIRSTPRGRARLAEAEAPARTHGGEIRRAAFAFPLATPAGQAAK
jgi:hypothetical protein